MKQMKARLDWTAVKSPDYKTLASVSGTFPPKSFYKTHDVMSLSPSGQNKNTSPELNTCGERRKTSLPQIF